MKKLTPVYVVERIEPCLDFWVGRLGFEKVVEIPEGNALGFVILTRGHVEIMYQSLASVAKDDIGAGRRDGRHGIAQRHVYRGLGHRRRGEAAGGL